MNKKARHKARILAMQAIYQWQMAGHDITALEEQYRLHNQTLAVEWPFFEALLNGVSSQVSHIDASFKDYLNRPIEDVTPVELSILRVAAFELSQANDIPYKVTINEYIELAKSYGGVDGYKFVNGVLDKLAKTLGKPASE